MKPITMEDIYRKSIQKEARTDNWTEVARQALQRDQGIIMRFISQRDVPGWYRGLSIFQMEAANALLNALRDDSEQSTSHRVRICLDRIGLIPKLNCAQTKNLMRLSRGNDLAFLWFLNELHYKTKGSGYSVNEQLIYSTIAHLDMVTTLRELHRILPPPQPPKKPPPKYDRKKLLLKRDKAYMKRWMEWKRRKLGPYFEPMRLPPEFSIPLTVQKPSLSVKFAPYHVWSDPRYKVANEKNRWYANYSLDPSKRIARGIIREEIQNIFDDFAGAALKSHTVNVLCEKHKTITELEKHLETELQAIARDRCPEGFDLDKNRVRRVKQQLEKDVERYMSQFREIAKKARRQCVEKTLSHESRCAYLVRNDKNFDRINVESDWENEEIRMVDSVGNLDYVDPNRADREKVERHMRYHGGRECECTRARRVTSTTTARDIYNPRNTSCRENLVRKCRSNMTDFSDKYLKNYDYGHSDSATPAASQTYFKAPSANKPHQFDFRKIFTFKQNNPKTIDIKRAFVEAVDCDLQVLQQLQDEDMPVDLDAVIHNCAKKIWKEQMRKKLNEEEALEEADRELKRKLDEESAERLRSIRAGIYKSDRKAKSGRRRRNVLNYNAAYYDPDDTNLMHEMLKNALAHMSQDPKFVLASMPDAHKMIMLREWVSHRFGKRYSHDYLANSLRLSWKIFHALDTVGMEIPQPSSQDIGRQLFIDYSCRDYIMQKNEVLKKRYYKELHNAIMEQARVLWFAMRPYMCSKGPPRHTYFAYMPARIHSISTFRPWRPEETMTSKNGREFN